MNVLLEISTVSYWFVTLGVSLAVAGGVVKGSIELWKWHKIRKIAFSRQFERRAEVYEIMNKILQETHAKRILVLKTTNGGGRPKSGSHIYASVLYEDFNPPFHSVVDMYQRIRVDKDYVKMLQHISHEGRRNLLISDMPPSLLRSIYMREGVALSQVYYLSENNTSFFYCSVATDEEGMSWMASDEEQIVINLLVGRLRDFFKKET